MRILLAGSTANLQILTSEIDTYIRLGHEIVVNDWPWPTPIRETARAHYQTDLRVSFESIDLSVPEILLEALARGANAYDAIVIPPDAHGFTDDVLRILVSGGSPHRRLRCIGCANDSVSKLAAFSREATNAGLEIIHTSGVHARSVAEYIMSQVGFAARRLGYFDAETGREGIWPHGEAQRSTHMLKGKVLGVLGGSGKDGAAVVSLAISMGLQVMAIGSGSSEGHRRMRAVGATVAEDVRVLLASSDFVSINCRPTPDTVGLIGSAELQLMKKGVVVVNSSYAEILDKQAVLTEFSKPPDERRVATLVFDIPYGGRYDVGAFTADPSNQALKAKGVRFTPRIAGYTVESGEQAVMQLAASIDRHLRGHVINSPIVGTGNCDGPTRPTLADSLRDDILFLTRQSSIEAIKLREAGLIVDYKPDGSPTTNADLAVESMIREGLASRGHTFRFTGEESHDLGHVDVSFDLIVDGIDGTRNFRDGNYGWCVSAAVRVGSEVLLGVVHDPVCDETYYATKGAGAFVWSRGTVKPCIIPRTLPPDFSFSVGSFRVQGSAAVKQQLIEDLKQLGGRERQWGSVALSICAVGRGGLGIFIQSRSQCHDHLAASLIAAEAGADVDVVPQSTAGVADVVASHPSLSNKVRECFCRRIAALSQEQL